MSYASPLWARMAKEMAARGLSQDRIEAWAGPDISTLEGLELALRAGAGGEGVAKEVIARSRHIINSFTSLREHEEAFLPQIIHRYETSPDFRMSSKQRDWWLFLVRQKYASD